MPARVLTDTRVPLPDPSDEHPVTARGPVRPATKAYVTGTKYPDHLAALALEDVRVLRLKDAEYGGSWLRRGGVGAYMMACRKFDRLEERVKRGGWDVFQAVREDSRAEGVIDDIRDLRRYLLLIEAQLVAEGTLAPPPPAP